jgi:hypothetical protein
MKRRQLVLALSFVTAGCSSRQQPLSPYVPPEAMYSAGGTFAAAGGVAAASIGTSMMDKDRSPSTRKAGAAVTGGGAALMGAAILEAIEVQKEREKLYKLYYAFLRDYYGTPAPEGPLRTPPPPPPDVPFELPVEESPLGGRDSRP